MKRIVLAALFATSLLVIKPSHSQAFGKHPQTYHGYGWLQGTALNVWPWLHFHGPLYNYGPYTTPGHVPMFVNNPWCGNYTPAYPSAYYGYESPPYYPNTIQPYFPGRPLQALTAPTNLYYAQGQPAESPPAVATTPPANEPAATTQPSTDAYYGGRSPIFFGQFRTYLRR
jgi:hypothetical protein